MSHKWISVCLLFLSLVSPAAYAQEEIRIVPLGQNLAVQYEALEPFAQYDVVLRDEDGRHVSFLRATADERGAIPEQILFYQSGVVGCARGADAHLELPYRFRTFDEAARGLAERVFSVELRPAAREESLPLDAQRVAFRETGDPLVYFSDREGCLMNAVTPDDDVFITARNLPRDFTGELHVARHQHDWQLGDPFSDARLLSEPQQIETGEREGSIVFEGWGAGMLAEGAYDVILRRGRSEGVNVHFGRNDIAGWLHDTGVVVQFGPDFGPEPPMPANEQIAARPLPRAPWFEHIDGFAAGADVWGAVDPSRVLGGGTPAYAACYVVDDQSSWADGDPLVDVSGAVEIMPIKPGCANATRTLLWPKAAPAAITASNPDAAYDVVLDFGTYNQNAFQSNGVYDAGADLVDGITGPGFWIVRDPRLPGIYGTVQLENPQSGIDCTLDVKGTTLTWSDPPFYTTGVTGTFAHGTPETYMWRPCGQTYDKLEMRGRFYLPAVNGNVPQQQFPLVVIVHGQQLPVWVGNVLQEKKGYLGYEYLGTLLSSHGFVVYSIDARTWEAASNGTRGELIRAHLGRLLQLNQGGSPVSGRLDMDNITLIGHSRGGDSVVAAYEWSRVSPAAYRIKALIGIAPTASLGGSSVEEINVYPHLRHIPYLLMQGSKDNDTRWFSGLITYDHAGHTPLATATAPKTMKWIGEANHNFFNSVWGQFGDEHAPPRDPSTLLDATVQRETAKSYINAALQAWISGQTGYRHYLDGTIPNVTSATVLHDYQSPSAATVLLDDFEDGDPAVTPANGTVSWSSLDSVTTFLSHNPYGQAGQLYPAKNRFLRVRWTQLGTYTFEVTPVVRMQIDPSAHRVLAFRAAQWYETGNNYNPLNTNISFEIQLRDAAGKTSQWLPISRFGGIPAPWDNGLTDQSFKPVMTGFRIPLTAFRDVNPAELASVTLRFASTKTGEVIVDDIRLTD